MNIQLRAGEEVEDSSGNVWTVFGENQDEHVLIYNAEGTVRIVQSQWLKRVNSLAP